MIGRVILFLLLSAHLAIANFQKDALPAPAVGVSVNGSLAQTNSDFTFAKSGLVLANGNNTFTVTATNAYGVTTNDVLTLNLPSSINFLSDSNGNLTGDGTRVFIYDAENQLTNVYVTNQWREDFIYDGFGRKRINRTYVWQSGHWAITRETRQVYDGMNPIQERDSNSVPLVIYTRGLDLSGSLQGAGGIGGLIARTDAHGSVYYHADGIGNITALIDSSEDIVGRREYDAYGRTIGLWGTNANRYWNSSKEYDSISGLVYYDYRFLEPNFQRWHNPDPAGEAGGANLYAYVGNNPLTFFDPLGLAGMGELHQAEEQMEQQALIDAAQEEVEAELRISQLNGAQMLIGELLVELDSLSMPRPGYPGDDASERALRRVRKGWIYDAQEAVFRLRANAPPVTIGMIPFGPGCPEGAAGIADEALVVRGGRNLAKDIARGIGTHPSGVTGFSVESAAGKSLEELSASIPHGQVGVTTVGDIRAAGGDVIRTSGRSINHATVTGLSPDDASSLLRPTVPNPTK